MHVCEVHSKVLISALISGAHGTITTPESSELLTTIFTKFFLVVFQYIYFLEVVLQIKSMQTGKKKIIKHNKQPDPCKVSPSQ